MNNKIKNLALLCLNTSEFNTLSNYLNNNKIDRARIFIDDLIEDQEENLQISHKFDKQDNLTSLNSLKQLENEIFNLYVEGDDERKQIKQSIE